MKRIMGANLIEQHRTAAGAEPKVLIADRQYGTRRMTVNCRGPFALAAVRTYLEGKPQLTTLLTQL